MSSLQGDDAAARADAALAVGIEQGSEAKKAVGALVAILRGDDLYAKPSAAYSLGRIGADAGSAEPALVAATRSSDWLLRFEAVTALGLIGSQRPEAFSAVLRSLDDKRVEVRRSAVTTLGQLGAGRTETLLALEKTLDDPETDIRRVASIQLGRMLSAKGTKFDPHTEQRVRKSVLTSAHGWLGGTDSGLRAAALLIIEQLDSDDARTFKLLRESMSDPKAGAASRLMDYAVGLLDREKSNRAPARLAEVVKLLIDAAHSESDQSRSFAVFYISNLAVDIDKSRAREAAKPLTESLVSTVVGALSDKSAEVRYAAARAMPQMGALGVRGLPELITLLKNDPDDRVRESSARAIGALGPGAGAAAIPALRDALAHGDTFYTVPPAAAGALARLGDHDPRIVKTLAAALTSRFPIYKDDVLISLSFAGPNIEGAIPAVISFLDDPVVSRRQWSARLLVIAGAAAKPAAPALERALRDEDPYVRLNAATALGQLAPISRPPMKALVRLLGDPDPKVRATAAWAVGRAGAQGRDVETALRSAKGDPDSETRFQAVVALACLGSSIGGDKALLLAALQKDAPSKASAMSAFECAARMLDPEAVDALRAASTNGDPGVRARSAELLGLPNPLARAAVPDLTRMTRDADPKVRAAAAASLRGIMEHDRHRTP